MQQLVRRPVKSSWSYGPTRLLAPRPISTWHSNNALILTSGGNSHPVVSHRSQSPRGMQWSHQVRHRGPYWWLDDKAGEEFEDVVYGDDRDIWTKPQPLPPAPWWAKAAYPRGLSKEQIEEKERHEKQEQAAKEDMKGLPDDPPSGPRKPRTRNYLTNHQLTSDGLVARLFGKENKQFHEFMRESRVERIFTLGKLMVDTPEVRGDFGYWLKLLRFRARLHGEKGVRDIWFGLVMRRIELPLRGPVADEMWRFFVRVAMEDEDFLKKLWRYHLHTYHKDGGSGWKHLYTEIVGGYLRKKMHRRALWWHYKFINVNPTKSFVNFFEEHAKNPDNLPTLLKIFSSSKIPALYRTIIPALCRYENYRAAIEWHRMLFKKKDFPVNSHPADRLLEYYAFHEPPRALEQMLREFHAKGIAIVESTVVSLIKPRYRVHCIMDLLITLCDSGVVPRDCFDDRFWAFLLSNERISDTEVKGYMSKLGVTRVGEWTTKEFVKRSRTIASFIRGIALLGKKQIPGDGRVLDRFLELKAKWLPDEALRESMPIEGLEISRSNALLQGYLSTYRWKHFDLVYKKIKRNNPVTWNLFLRRLFMTRQISTGLDFMEEMRAASIPLWTSSIRELLNAILLPRQPGRFPITNHPRARGTQDLYLATNYLKAIMISGEQVNPALWKELLKRYGMFRKLGELEQLCLWLVHWYDPRKAAQKRYQTPIQFTDKRKIASLAKSSPVLEWTEPPTSESNTSPLNPLRILFSATMVRAIVEWGFISVQKSWYRQLPYQRETTNLEAQKFVWGIRLAKKLKDSGVWVDTPIIARAVKIRLRALEGSRHEWDSFDTNMSKHAPINLALIAAIAERAWGEKLFPRGSWDTELGLEKMLKGPVKMLRLGGRRRKGKWTTLQRPLD